MSRLSRARPRGPGAGWSRAQQTQAAAAPHVACSSCWRVELKLAEPGLGHLRCQNAPQYMLSGECSGVHSGLACMTGHLTFWPSPGWFPYPACGAHWLPEKKYLSCTLTPHRLALHTSCPGCASTWLQSQVEGIVHAQQDAQQHYTGQHSKSLTPPAVAVPAPGCSPIAARLRAGLGTLGPRAAAAAGL